MIEAIVEKMGEEVLKGVGQMGLEMEVEKACKSLDLPRHHEFYVAQLPPQLCGPFLLLLRQGMSNGQSWLPPHLVPCSKLFLSFAALFILALALLEAYGFDLEEPLPLKQAKLEEELEEWIW